MESFLPPSIEDSNELLLCLLECILVLCEIKMISFNFLLWLSERSERNHSLLWSKSSPSHYFIKYYYKDTRVQKSAKSDAVVNLTY